MARFKAVVLHDAPVTVGARELAVSGKFRKTDNPVKVLDLNSQQKTYFESITKPYINLQADNTVYTSNTAPTLDPGNEYTLTVTINGSPLSPVLAAASIAALVTAADGNATYNTHGDYAVVGQTITLSSNSVNSATLVIGQQAEA